MAENKRRAELIHGAENDVMEEDYSDFEGMTPSTCASGCSENGCVITTDGQKPNLGTCGHPYKSGLQSAHYMRPKILANFERAKRFLKLKAIK
jgi:hypothetical protein